MLAEWLKTGVMLVSLSLTLVKGQGQNVSFGQGQGPAFFRYNWTNLDRIYFIPDNYGRDLIYPRPLHNISVSDSAKYFKALCSTPERLERECHGWTADDLAALREAQKTVDQFEGVLNQYYDFGIQLIGVLYVWGCGFYLIWKRHFVARFTKDPHRIDPTLGCRGFLFFDMPFLAEEVKTIVVTDSEDDDQIFFGVDLSDYISESSEDERRERKKHPEEYGRLVSRKIRHEDELENPKYKNQRVIKRKKINPNINNPMNGSHIRNLEPPKSAGKKFDQFGTPKYPRIYEIRRKTALQNRFLSRF